MCHEEHPSEASIASQSATKLQPVADAGIILSALLIRVEQFPRQ
jgi:hypothetical protein